MKWKPGIVKQQCTSQPRAYIIEGETGGVYQRNRRHIRSTGETFTFDTELNNEPPAHSDGEPDQQGSVTLASDNPNGHVYAEPREQSDNQTPNSGTEHAPAQNGFDLGSNSDIGL